MPTSTPGDRGAGETGPGEVEPKGALSLLAPAKVNLYLHVLGRRADGYHDLDSLVVFADVGDRIAVAADDRLSFAVDGPFAAAVPDDDNNLVMRAARAMADAAGVRARARINLTKRLPVAAGIGGGSADAAAALRVLARLWGVRPLAGDLERIALTLGADVPVCLRDGPTWLAGVGEDLAPAPALPPVWLVLVNPGVAVPTPAVFRRRAGPFSQPARFAEAPADAAALAALLAGRRNDLTAAAIAVAPLIGEVLETLGGVPGVLLARMSGSGATCFALFDDRAAAAAAAAALATAQPTWWTAAAPLRAGP